MKTLDCSTNNASVSPGNILGPDEVAHPSFCNTVLGEKFDANPEHFYRTLSAVMAVPMPLAMAAPLCGFFRGSIGPLELV
jgi:hypothetical protein